MELSEYSSNTDDGNVKGSSVDQSSERKRKLEEEIEDLSNTLKKLRKELNVVKVKRSLTADDTYDVSDISINRVTPIHIQLELYRYGGLYCMKSTNSKKVVGLNSSIQEQDKKEFAIEFIKQGNDIKTGKWVMPMSVDMEQLQSEVELKSIKNLLHFIRNCKQHTDCHESRLQQFKELKSAADNLRNCNVQTNLGYTLVTIELLHVCDKTNDNYFNLSIYIWYNSKCGRPTNVKFEISKSTKYNKETEIQLKKSLKVFRSNDLRTAFDIVFNKNSEQFTWERAKKEDYILEINESTSSLDDEVSLYKRLAEERLTRKRPREKLKKQSRKKKKEDNSNNDINQQDADVKEIYKPSTSKSPLRVTRNTVKSKVMYQSTLDKFTNKLHLAKKKKMDSNTIEKKLNIKPLVIKVQKINKKYTSTPIKPNQQSNTPFKALPSIDISKITPDNSYVEHT